MSGIHLHAIEGEAPQSVLDDEAETEMAMEIAPLAAAFFVLQRQNGHWSVAAKVMAVFDREDAAEQAALALKRGHPQQHFGIAMLRSEAREVEVPFKIVKVAP